MPAPGFREIPTVLTDQELVDKAFARASKISIQDKDPFARAKSTEIARLRSVANTLDASLSRYVKTFPSFDNLPPFYRDLVRLLVDVDHARRSLGAIDWARNRILSFADEAVPQMKRARTADGVGTERKKTYARIADVLKQVRGDLLALNEVREHLRKLPEVSEDPTIVVAGYPNVGKSSLIRRVSTAEPEVAPYPFTTKGVAIGHFDLRRVRYQIVDTPGVLDRPVHHRNAIEKQAITALEHLGDTVVFLLDPSELCGYPMEAQEHLLAEVERVFPDAKLHVAENKTDVEEGKFTGRRDRHRISTLSGAGVEELMDAACASALDRWKARMARTG